MFILTSRMSYLSTAAFAFAGLPTVAQAQVATSAGSQTSDEELMNVGDIIVTAQKRSETVNQVGISISALSGDTLIRQGITSIDQLVKAVPGFNYTRTAYGSPVFTLRGIGFNETTLAAAPTVSIYLDEVPLPYSPMAQGVTLDVERVEVLKGPQGTLFGQNSTGGAINYVAARPTKKLAGGFDVTLGRFDQIETNGFISGPLTETIRARLAVRKEYSGDWQRSATRPGDTMGSVDRVQARLLVDWDTTDRLRMSFNLNGWKDQSDPLAGQYAGPLSSRAPAVLQGARNSWDDARLADWDAATDFYTNDDFWQIAGRADYDVGDSTTVTWIGAYEHFRRDTNVDADGTAIQNFAAIGRGFIKTITQELRIAGSAGEGIDWMVGANYQHDDSSDSIQPRTAVSSLPFRVATAIGLNEADTYAAFGNVDWKIGAGLSLIGGLRYTKQNRSYAGCLYDSGAGDLAAVVSAASTRLSGTPTTIAAGGCVTLDPVTFKPGVYQDDLNEGNVSWKAGINWQIDPRKLLYGSVSRGYKNGVFVTTGATFAAQLAPVNQETVLAYEVGFKLGLLGRSVQLNGAAFYYDYQDKQIRGRVIDPIAGGFNKLLNIPKSRIQGAELQLVVEPTAGLRLTGGATYVDTKILGNFVNFTPLLTQKLLSGEPFPLTPKWQLTGDAQYDFAVSGRTNVFIGASATYQSGTNSALGREALFDVKAYTLVDARIGIRDAADLWRLSGFVKNVGDVYYWSNVAFNSTDAAIRYAARPRTYGLTFSYRYR